jgi:hypothetical protein
MLKILCWVSDSWHSAKKLKNTWRKFFAECQIVGTRQSTSSTLPLFPPSPHVLSQYNMWFVWVSSNVRHNVLEIFLFSYHSLHMWYHDILAIFVIFWLGLYLIEFKNKSSASPCPCFVNTMFEILGAFLDSSS